MTEYLYVETKTVYIINKNDSLLFSYSYNPQEQYEEYILNGIPMSVEVSEKSNEEGNCVSKLYKFKNNGTYQLIVTRKHKITGSVVSHEIKIIVGTLYDPRTNEYTIDQYDQFIIQNIKQKNNDLFSNSKPELYVVTDVPDSVNQNYDKVSDDIECIKLMFSKVGSFEITLTNKQSESSLSSSQTLMGNDVQSKKIKIIVNASNWSQQCVFL